MGLARTLPGRSERIDPRGTYRQFFFVKLFDTKFRNFGGFSNPEVFYNLNGKEIEIWQTLDLLESNHMFKHLTEQ